jgi:putative photosynthetic complex assembly protein
MGDPIHEQTIPRGALLGAGALLVAAVVATAVARYTGVGTTHLPAAAPVAAAELRFLDGADGSVVVLSYPEGVEVAVLPPGQHGFARGVLRGLARDRRLAHLDSGPPFRLVRWSDGRLSLEDPATRRAVALEAFGPDNARVFAGLLATTHE